MIKTKEFKIKQLTEKITKGTTPSNIGETFTEEGVMYIRSELVGKSKYIDKSSGLLFISKSTHEKLKRSQIKENDMLFSIAGIYLGKISLVRAEDCPSNTNQAVAIIRFNSSEIDLNYIYYYMTQKWFNSYVNSLTAQAAQPNINLEQIGKLKLNLPCVEIQRKISSIISYYDDLIETNNKRIKLLEQMAENLYKEWFVRFRFPNYKKTKFVKGIPEGWRYIKVLEITTLKSGYAFSSEDFSDINGDCAVAKIKDISGLFMDTNDFSYVNEEKCKNAKKFILNIGDLTIALTGATIGKIGIVPKFDKKIYTNQRLGKFFNGENPINNLPYLFCLFSQKQIQQNILNISNSSSAQPNISPEQIENIKILSNKSIIEQFNNYTKSIFEQMIKLHDINKNLIKQRDLLLPRLMSGKLEV